MNQDLYSRFGGFLNETESIQKKLSEDKICTSDQMQTLNLLLKKSLESFDDFFHATQQEDKINTVKIDNLFLQLKNEVISYLPEYRY